MEKYGKTAVFPGGYGRIGEIRVKGHIATFSHMVGLW